MIIPMQKGRKVTRISHLSSAKLIKMLVNGPVTCKAIQEGTGLNPGTVRRYVNAMRDEGLVYKAGKERLPSTKPEYLGPGRSVLWMFGPGIEDVYVSLSPTECKKQSQRRIRALRQQHPLHIVKGRVHRLSDEEAA